MSDTGDDQYAAEILDDDEVDLLDYPPDHSLGVDDLLDDDVPAAGEYAPDDLRHRLAREEPEVTVGGGGDFAAVAPGGVIDPDDAFGPDGTKELIGELGEPDSDVGGVILADSARAGRGSDTWPAEEAALHLEQDDIVLDDDEPSRH
jgi:hypothetical protein